MSAMGQKRTSCYSFDHLVGAREQRRWHGQAKRLGSLEVEHKLVFGRRLHRKIGRLLALEDAVDVAGCGAVLVDIICAIGDQPAAGNRGAVPVHRGQLVAGRKLDDQIDMNSRQRARRDDQTAVRGAREGRNGALDLGRVANVDRAHPTPTDGATDWIATNWPIPAVMVGSRRTAARVTPGAISLSSSSHFPLTPYSKLMNPVALRPGRARLSTKPEPTGSGTSTNTIGTVRVALSNCFAAGAPVDSMTSGVSAANSAAYLRMRSVSPPPQR